AVGLARANIELPAVPRATDDLTRPRVVDLAGIFGLRKPDQRPLAQPGALMRAAIQQAEKLALDVEDRDWPSVDGEKLARTRWQLLHRRDDMTGHSGNTINLLRIAEIERLAVGIADACRQHPHRLVKIPVRIVGGEQKLVPADPVDDVEQMLAAFRVFHRLRGPVDVVADIFRRRPLDV